MAEKMSVFATELRESIAQAQRGEFARVHTLAMIAERVAKRGRPAGSIQAVTKEAISLRLDPSALEQLRCTGKGWQTRAAQVLERHAKRLSAKV